MQNFSHAISFRFSKINKEITESQYVSVTRSLCKRIQIVDILVNSNCENNVLLCKMKVEKWTIKGDIEDCSKYKKSTYPKSTSEFLLVVAKHTFHSFQKLNHTLFVTERHILFKVWLNHFPQRFPFGRTEDWGWKKLMESDFLFNIIKVTFLI